MKNFDETRSTRRFGEDDRTFVFHGETFVLRDAVRPEALDPFDKLDESDDVGSTMALLDQLMLNVIDDRDGAHDRYRAARADEADPVTAEDIRELMEWAIEVVTGRTPTGSASASTGGPPRTTTTSTDGSSSPVSPVVQAA
jgi:hypothetical protein